MLYSLCRHKQSQQSFLDFKYCTVIRGCNHRDKQIVALETTNINKSIDIVDMNRFFVFSLHLCSALLILIDVSGSFGFSSEKTICNNVEDLCDLPVNEILFGMVHNAMSSPSAGFFFFANHLNDPIVESLDQGYRGLSLDLCNCNGNLIFCHGGTEVGCGIGQRDPLETFTQINEWITTNPNNVIMIWLQINDNAGDPISLDDAERLVNDVPIGNADKEFADRLYRGENDDEWPAMSHLIQNGQQVIFFYMGGPDGQEESNIGIHYFYEYGMSTDWSYASVPELRESVMDGCKIQRDSSNTRDFFMINTFVTKKVFGYQVKPSRTAAKEINDGEFLEPLLEVCEQTQKSKVNIISVDFWKSGDLINYIDDRNSKLAIAHNPENLTPTSSSNYLPHSEQPISLQDHSQQPSGTTGLGLDDGDSVSSTSSSLPNNNQLLKTKVPSYYDDNDSVPSTPSTTRPSPHSERLSLDDGAQRSIHRNHKPQQEDTPNGNNPTGPKSEESSLSDLDQSMSSPWLEQPNEEEKITESSSSSALMAVNDHLDGNLDDASTISILSYTWAASIGIVLVITSTV